MVVEVNKLIANALIADGGIYLPEIGSISIETTTPESGSAAPTRDIILRDKELFKSLVAVISERGNCTLQQGEQVYKRWKDIVVTKESIVILGIGEVKGGKFITAPQMLNKLNPVQAAKVQPIPTPTPEPVPTPIAVEEKPKVVAKEETPKPAPKPKVETLKPAQKATPKPSKKSSKSGYALALVAEIAIVIGVTLYTLTNNDSSAHQNSMVANVEPSEATIEVAEATEAAPVAEAKSTPAPAPQKKQIDLNSEPTAILEQALMPNMSSTQKYKVVFGVYSSPSNAGRMIANVKKSTAGKNLDVRAYNYRGDKYLLTIFESSSASECETFRKSELGKSISNDLWVYERK